MSFDPYQINLLSRLGPCENKVVANLGAGRCDSPISEQFKALRCARLINVEAWAISYNTLTRVRFDAAVVENFWMDLGVWLGRRDDASVDIIVMLDVLEHFAPPATELLLSECIRVAKESVVIWLPFGVCPQDALEDNPYQKHLSTWAPADFGDGWQVEVFKGFHGHFSPAVDAGWAIYRGDRK